MDRKVNGEYILNISRGYWASWTLFWGVETGVFTLLEQKERSAREIADILRTEPGATERVLNALASLGLLVKKDGCYTDSDVSRTYLVQGKDSYLGNAVHHARNLWEGWTRLGDAVRTGRGVAFDIVEKGPYEQRLRDFLLAMRDNAGLTAAKVADFLQWGNFREMLDLGAGPGAYTVAFLKKYPALRSTIYDLEPSVAMAKEMLNGSEVAERISFRSGDFTRDDLGEGLFDAVLVANVIHIYDHAINNALVEKIFRTLKPGGQLAIYDYFLDEDHPSPEAALFDLNMLIGTVNGRNYPYRVIVNWLEKAGFNAVYHADITDYSGLVVAEKPA